MNVVAIVPDGLRTGSINQYGLALAMVTSSPSSPLGG